MCRGTRLVIVIYPRSGFTQAGRRDARNTKKPPRLPERQRGGLHSDSTEVVRDLRDWPKLQSFISNVWSLLAVSIKRSVSIVRVPNDFGGIQNSSDSSFCQTQCWLSTDRDG